MRSLRLLLCVTALTLAACETQPTHEVLALTEVSPRQVETGDRLVFQATGLPLPQDIRRITLRIAGDLARPGMDPCARPVALTVVDPPEEVAPGDGYLRERPGESYADGRGHHLRLEGGTRLELFLRPEMVRALTRCPGERGTANVSHATLALTGPHGGASLRIETTQGTVLASARALRGPRLDLHLAEARSLAAENTARTEAERVLGSLGITLATAHPVEGGLQVDRVLPGSHAEAAGITEGDVLLRLDGVSLLAVGDFRPPHGADRATVSLRRGDVVDDHPIRLTAVSRGVPSDLVATGVLLFAALGLLALARMGTPGSLQWLFTPSPRSPSGTGDSRATGPVARGWSAWKRGELPVFEGPRGREDAALAAAALVTAALAVPFGQIAFSLDPDAVITHLGLALVALGFPVLHAWRGASSRRAPSALATLAGRGFAELLGAIGLGAVVVATGALHLQAIVAAQGAMPWCWNVLRDPTRLLLGALALVPLALAVEDRAEGVVERAARWTVTVLRCALVVAVWCGGWAVPGVSPAQQDASVSLQMLGVLLLVVKTWGVVVGLRACGPVLQRLPAVPRRRFALRVALPWALVALALQVAAAALALRLPWIVANVTGRILAGATTAIVASLGLARVLRVALARRGIVSAEAVVVG